MKKYPLMGKSLAVGIILLFVGTCIIPAIAQDIEKSSQPTSRENWLYVGGSGPGNYTTIQDAIDNASKGDTVFVYDDSSPYYENIKINKKIDLIGEDKISTTIDSNHIGNVVTITASYSSISGFRIINSGIVPDYGIRVESARNCSIFNNILENNAFGICLDGWNVPGGMCIDNLIFNNTVRNSKHAAIRLYDGCSGNQVFRNTVTENGDGIEILSTSNDCFENNIFENNVKNNREGIALVNSHNNNISRNNISNNSYYGIWLDGATNIIIDNIIKGNKLGIIIMGHSRNNLITKNNITDSTKYGISLEENKENVISWNNIKNNFIGIRIWMSNNNEITYNIFVNNMINAYFINGKNIWDSNYWDNLKLIVKPIFGIRFLILPWVQFDWHPAQEPYDIPGMT